MGCALPKKKSKHKPNRKIIIIFILFKYSKVHSSPSQYTSPSDERQGDRSENVEYCSNSIDRSKLKN